MIIHSPNKIGEAYTEKCAGRRGYADPENWHSRQLRNPKLRSTRGLTPTEVNTEASVMVRMWRASGVKRLWHVHRDAVENLRDPLEPRQESWKETEMLEARSEVETVLRWLMEGISYCGESDEVRDWTSGRWSNGSRIKRSTLRLGESATWGRS